MSVQNKELFIKFVEFCDSQPKDGRINHFGSYYDCAVGAYADSIGEDISDWSHQVHFTKELLQTRELYLKVGNADEYPELATYGGYTEFLKTYL